MGGGGGGAKRVMPSPPVTNRCTRQVHARLYFMSFLAPFSKISGTLHNTHRLKFHLDINKKSRIYGTSDSSHLSALLKLESASNVQIDHMTK